MGYTKQVHSTGDNTSGAEGRTVFETASTFLQGQFVTVTSSRIRNSLTKFHNSKRKDSPPCT